MRDIELDEKYMKIALEGAEQAGQEGEVPVGTILLIGFESLYLHQPALKLRLAGQKICRTNFTHNF